MSSYKVNLKTGLPILYLCDQKCNLWEKFIETYPNGMKKTAFLARTNLKYREDLSGLCQTCNNYGYEPFDNLIAIARNTFQNKDILVSSYLYLFILKFRF